MAGPRILIYDIELAPILAHVWGIWQQNIGLNQIQQDWFVLSWAAKWLDEKKIFYYDQRNSKEIENDKKILIPIWDLLDEADIVVTQNGKSFDQKKLNTRFLFHGMPPPKPSKHIDTKLLAKKHFSFTSNKLEHLSAVIAPESTKSSHSQYPGHELWKAVLRGDMRAWREMEKYNKQDVLATEAIYKRMASWGAGIDLNLFREGADFLCDCGSNNFRKRGFHLTKKGKFQQFQCRDCGAWKNSSINLLSFEKKRSL